MGYTGYQGKDDKLHFKFMNLHKFEAMCYSLINGALKKRDQSSKADVDNIPFFQNGDEEGFQLLISQAWMAQHVASSPVIWSLRGSNNGKELKWGNQYIRSDRNLEREFLPLMVAENLRMMHPAAVTNECGKNKTDFYYICPIWPQLADRYDLEDNFIPSWNGNVLGGIDPRTMVDGSSFITYNTVMSAGLPFYDYIKDVTEDYHQFKEFYPIQAISAWRETGVGSQLALTNNYNAMVISKAGEEGYVCIPVSEALDKGVLSCLSPVALKHIRDLLDQRARAGKASTIFKKYQTEARRDELAAARAQSTWVARAAPLSLGMGQSLPADGRFNIYKQLALPDINIPINGAHNNVSQALNKFKLRDTVRAESTSVMPIAELMTSCYVNTVTRGSTPSAATELVRSFVKKALPAKVQARQGVDLEHLV